VHGSTEVRGGRATIDGGERVIDVLKAQLGIKERNADRRLTQEAGEGR
jgi:hypothetical protein